MTSRSLNTQFSQKGQEKIQKHRPQWLSNRSFSAKMGDEWGRFATSGDSRPKKEGRT